MCAILNLKRGTGKQQSDAPMRTHYTALTTALNKCHFKIAKSLILCEEQEFKGITFLNRLYTKKSITNYQINPQQKQGIQFLHDLIQETKGKILDDRFEMETRNKLYQKLVELYKYLSTRGKDKKGKDATTSTTNKLMKFFQIDASNKDNIQTTSQKKDEEEEQSVMDHVRGILLALEKNLNVADSVVA